MYDIFFIGQDEELWKQCKTRYPNAQKISQDIKITDLQKKSFTSMFWVIWSDLTLTEFNLYEYTATKYDNMYVHIFKNGNFYDGICLIPKNKNITQREFENRFFIDKKEIDIVASHPQLYDRYMISSFDEYLEITKTSKSSMFYVVWPDIDINIKFNFDFQVIYHDQHITHVFQNGDYYDGICLFSKNKLISKKEFDNRFFLEKKEVDIVASFPKKFNIFSINRYDEYLECIDKSTTNMFYVIWNDIVIDNKFQFDYQVPYYNQHITHVFKNKDYYDGLCLFSKNTLVSQREFDYRFFTDKKEVNISASEPKPFDVVFISYFEKFADENFKKIGNHLLPYQDLYRVDGIKGIHNAHKRAAEIVKSDMFWVVDADAILENDFKFEFPQVVSHDSYTKTIVHVWRSRNPINDLEYGHGGVKLLPKKLTMNMDMTKPDMTTSISASFKAIPKISNVAGFNTDPLTTWRSAFRECVKLASRTIQGQLDKESEERLDIWCTVGKDRPFGEYAVDGAIAGREYGLTNRINVNELRKINDFKWLEEQFCERYRTN